MIYFILVIIYTSWVYGATTHSDEAGDRVGWLHWLLGCLLLIWTFYLGYLEFKQIQIQRIKYFTSSSAFWNLIDFTSVGAVVAFAIADLS
jgi:hypothetical protein